MAINNQYDKIHRDSLHLEGLQQKYSNLLIQYKKAVSNYINYLNKNKTEFSVIRGKAYMGTGSAGESTAKTINQCKASCTSNPNCTGATFISNTCSIRTGDSPIIPSTSESKAIVPKEKVLLLKMENINYRLMNINNQIQKTIHSLEPSYDKYDKENEIKSIELSKNYDDLVEERNNIQKLIREYENLENTQKQGEIKINQNYYYYILYFLLAVIIVYFLYKLSYPINQNVTSSTYSQLGGRRNK